jgi:PAS domain S-box-containing protein
VRFSLTVKMIGVCAGALMLATAVLTGITAAALLDAFRDVERAHMETQAQRVRQEFHDYLERRMVSASDWGNWDELHFAARDGRDAEFFATNVNAIAARNLNANLILLVGNDGSPRSSFFYDFAAKQAGTPPEDLLALFTGASARLPVASVTKCVFGAFGTSRGTAAFAACPLLNSAGEGPSSGLLVTAHYIDAETVEQIANTMQASITCLPFASDGLPEDFRRAKRSLSTASPVTTGPLGEDRVGAYACITDPAGQPLLIARIDEARTMYQIGASAIRWYALVIVLVGISTVFVLAIALRAIILRPLSRLTRHVSQVANTGTLAPFQHTGPMDEIGVLAQEFNDMVECLAEAREQVLTQSREVSESELRYRVLVELAPMAIAVEVGGSIRYVNSAMLRLLGSTDQSVGAGRALCDFLDPASSGACAEAIANVTRMGGRQQGISGVLNRADGTAAHVEIACACIVYGGEIGVQLALQDVTEARALGGGAASPLHARRADRAGEPARIRRDHSAGVSARRARHGPHHRHSRRHRLIQGV